MNFAGNKITLPWIKENLSLIILAPTVLGGLWQLVALASLGLPYIRFFSVSQLIPDGLLILLISGFVWFLSYGITRPTAKADSDKSTRNDTTLTTQQVKKEKHRLIILLCTVVLVIAFLIFCFWYILTIIVELAPSDSFWHLVSEFLIAVLVFRFVHIGNSVLNQISGQSIYSRNPFVRLIFITASILSFLTLLGLSIQFLKVFHTSFLFSENFKNMEKIRFNTKHSSNKIELIYFNDKYLFINYQDSAKKEIVEVLKFEDLFDNDDKR